MQTPGQLDPHRSQQHRSHPCELWESLIPDALDGTLAPAEQHALDRHIAGCVHCAEQFSHAQRGAAWLGMLKAHAPEPSTDLIARILAATTGAQPATAAAAASAAAALPAFAPEPISDIWTRERPLQTPARPSLVARFASIFKVENSYAGFQPRMAMTASMAFFSIALTLNLMGVNLRHISTASLRPSSISRSLADTRASMTRTFQNNRVVYQFESRVSDFRRDELPQSAFPDTDSPDATSSPSTQDSTQDSTPGSSPDSNRPARPDPGKPAHGSSELVFPTQPKPASIPTYRKEA